MKRLLAIWSRITPLLAVWAAFHLASPAIAAQPPIAVSVAAQSSLTGAGNSFAPVVSEDGRFIAFLSHANNLVTNDNLAPHLDLFVRDLDDDSTTLVSIDSNGVGGANADVSLIALSRYGRVVAFETAASNLAPGDANRASDIYVRDLATGVTRLASVNAAGTGAGNGSSFNPRLSSDGHRLVFESMASDLVTNDFNGTNDVFIRDLLTGDTTLASANAEGSASAEGSSHSPALSADGRFVAFVSHATNLVAGVSNRLGEIYLRDIAAGSNRWVMASHLSATRLPVSGAYSASEPVMSYYGRFVAFKTAAGAVVRSDVTRPTNTVREAFRSPNPPPHFDYFTFHDNPRLVNLPLTGLGASPLALTPDGRYLAFTSGTNAGGAQFHSVLRADFEGVVTNVARLHCCAGSTANFDYYETNVTPAVLLVSTNLAGQAIRTNHGYAPSISANGQRILFLGQPNLTDPPSDGQLRLQLRDLATDTLVVVSTNRTGKPASLVTDLAPALSPDGAIAVFESTDDDLVVEDRNAAFDIFVRNLGTGGILAASRRHPARPAATGRGIASVGSGGVSAEGRRVALNQYDNGLRPLATNRWMDSALRDLRAGTNTLLSANYFLANPPAAQTFVPPTNHSALPRISADGRYATFAVGKLGYPNGTTNVIWRDLVGGTNLTLTGANSSFPTMSADGRMVAFHSQYDPATLAYTPFAQVWLFAPEVTFPFPPTRVGRVTPPGDNHSINPVISADGGWIAFQSLAANLTADPDLLPATDQLFAMRILRGPTNTVLGSTKLVSYTTSASPHPFGVSFEQPLSGGATNSAFSGDSRYLFFESVGARNILRHDLFNDFVVTLTFRTNQIHYTNRARTTNLVICADCANAAPDFGGRLVAFESPVGPGATRQVWLRDIASGSNELVSVRHGGATGGNGSSSGPLVTADGRFVVFTSAASDLVPGDNNRANDVFARERVAGVTFCLSRNASGAANGNGPSSHPVLSPDGRSVAFQSFSSDLVPGDYNDTRDVFIVSLGGPDTDGDGLDDDWEVTYFDDLSRDGTGDLDGDGASDSHEFRAGTDPTDTGSVFRVLTLTTATFPFPQASRTTIILWAATPFRSYRVQFKNGDLSAPWTDLPGDVLATGTTASKTHFIRFDPSSPAFYRVRSIE